MVEQEFQDVEAFPICQETIHDMIDVNLKTLEASRKEYIEELRSSIVESMSVLLQKGSESDNRVVSALLKKEEETLLAMSCLDITEIEDGKAQNLMLFLSYMDALERINKLKAKLTGLDALRDFEIFRMKEELKTSLNSNDLIPPVKGHEVTKNGTPLSLPKQLG